MKFAAFCHFLADMLTIIAKLSLKMQGTALSSLLVSSIHETVANLESLKICHLPVSQLDSIPAVDR